MDSTSVYGLELLVLEGTGGKTLATDHHEEHHSYVKFIWNNSYLYVSPLLY